MCSLTAGVSGLCFGCILEALLRVEEKPGNLTRTINPSPWGSHYLHVDFTLSERLADSDLALVEMYDAAAVYAECGLRHRLLQKMTAIRKRG